MIPPQQSRNGGNSSSNGDDGQVFYPASPEGEGTLEPLFMDTGVVADEALYEVSPALSKEGRDISPPAPAHSASTATKRVPAAVKKHLGEAVFYLEAEKISPNPHQPRRHFDETAIRELASSIREFGILQPLLVSKIVKEVPTGTEVEYELIAGERRLLAAKMLGLERVPAIVRNINFERERLELAVIENLQREDLNAVEMARAFSRLQDEFRMTQREIALRLGKSREVVANTLRLLDLPSDVQAAIEKNELSESHGRLLLTVSDPAVQQRLLKDLLSRHMTTRELKEQVETLQQPRTPKSVSLSPELRALQERLSSELGAPVLIKASGPPAGGGKITITFYSEEELNNIIHRFMKETGEII